MVLLNPASYRALSSVCFAAVALAIAACSTVDVSAPPLLERGARWGLVPFINNTETPQAGLREESIAESLLRSVKSIDLEHYPANLNDETLFEPMDRRQQDAAMDWAKKQGIRYVVSGSVDEWRYKVGVDGEPAVGLMLKVVDVSSGKVIWSAVGSGTGWSREALSAVAQKLTKRLIEPLNMNKP